MVQRVGGRVYSISGSARSYWLTGVLNWGHIVDMRVQEEMGGACGERERDDRR
jgi:hypothetical protein